MSSGKRQGVISGSIDFDNTEYVEIFDAEYKYLYGQIDDLFVQYGNWVEYYAVRAPQNHPVNCVRLARDIQYVDVKRSCAPTSDEFRSNNMDVRDYNKVDFFQFDSSDGNLTHKSTIQRDPRDNKYFNSYYGAVSISSDAHRRLLEHRIDELDVMMSLIASRDYKSGPHWEVVHFIHQGKCYSINGYLSITGHVLRGPKGVVRNRAEVIVPPDSLRPRNSPTFGFGGSPTGNRVGLGARANWSNWTPSPRTPPQSDGSQTMTVRGTTFAYNGLEKKPSAAESTRGVDEFNGTHDSTIDPTLQKLSLNGVTTARGGGPGGNRTTTTTAAATGFGFGFGRSSPAARPLGLGRLATNHF